jgi:hypothetical protein
MKHIPYVRSEPALKVGLIVESSTAKMIVENDNTHYKKKTAMLHGKHVEIS